MNVFMYMLNSVSATNITTTPTIPRSLNQKLRMRCGSYYFVLPQAINEEPPERALINTKQLEAESDFFVRRYFHTWSHTTPNCHSRQAAGSAIRGLEAENTADEQDMQRCFCM